VQRRSGEREVTVLGYCMGGVLSTIYAASHPRDGLTNLVCFTTPIDFRHMTLFQQWSNPKHFDVDRLVDTVGNVPADLIFRGFEMLRPASRAAGQVQLWDNMWKRRVRAVVPHVRTVGERHVAAGG
jgi:polyhydroxyalkanoate synthase